MARSVKPAVLPAWDLDDICDRIASGETYSQIAAFYGRTQGRLSQWLEEDSNRSARARAARVIAARVWDEKAAEVVEIATDPFELAKARELAHHYRWRASKTSPDYAEKSSVKHSGVVGTVDIGAAITDDARERVAREMLRESGYEFDDDN